MIRGQIWLPWVRGPEENPPGPVLVSLTNFEMRSFLDLPGIARGGLRLRAGWYGLPGAVGLHLWMQLGRHRLGSLSVWTNESDFRRWIQLPLHVIIMRRYRTRGTLRSVTWWTDVFDRVALVREARERILAAP